MVKKHFLYLVYEIKSSFKNLPKIILCTVLFAFLVVITGVCGSRILSSSSKYAVHFNVAVVLPDDDPDVELCYSLLNSMESVSATCDFLRVSHDEAVDMLKDGSVVAVFEIPKGFVSDLMYGENTPATIIIPDNAGMESLFFCSMIDAGSNTLANSESGIYAVSDLLYDYDIDPEDAQDELFEHYLKYTLNRNIIFNARTLSRTGVTSLKDFYISTGLVFTMLLCAMAITGTFSRRSRALDESLRTIGISRTYTKFCEYTGVTLMFFILFSLIYTVGAIFVPDTFALSFTCYVAVFFVSASVVSFIMFICCITDSGLVSSLVIFLTSTLVMYVCGRIVPKAYLPDIFSKISAYLPGTFWCNLTDTVFSGRIMITSLIGTIICAVLFYGLSMAVTVFKRRSV